MAEIKLMREQMARLATEARSKFDEIKDDTPEARASEIEREFDAGMAEHDKIGVKVERLERLQTAERNANAADESRRPTPSDVSSRAVDQGKQLSYRQAFYELQKNGGAEGLAPEARAIVEARMQVAGTDSAGGFTVPDELSSIIEESMIATGPMNDSNLFTVINTSSGNKFEIPTLDDTAVTAEAIAEGATPTDDGGKDATFGVKTLEAFSFDTEFVKWSRVLAQDSIHNMESLLGRLLGERLGRLANAKLTTGSGSSDVEGIVTNTAAGVTAAATAAITSDELLDLIHSVDPAYRTSASTRFMMNDSTIKAIRKLKDGDGNYLWQMGNIQAGIPDSIFGYNIVLNQAMASVATGNKAIIFGDMSKYYVRKVGSPILFLAKEKFIPDLGVLGYMRIDGVLTNTAAIKHLVLA